MSARLSRFNILSWPIWVKLTVGFSVALIILTAPVVIILRAALVEISLQNARSFVAEIGRTQTLSISSSVAQARDNLDNFINNENYQRQLTGLLLNDSSERSGYNVPYVSPEAISLLFRQTILNPVNTVYDYVRVLDRNGIVVAQSSLIASGVLARNESQSAAYLNAVNSRLQGENRTLSIDRAENGDTIIELVNVIEWRNGAVLGYIVARLNNARVIYDHLRLEGSTIDLPGFSFLTTQQGYLLVAGENRSRAEERIESPPVERALDGESGIEVYRLQNNQPENVAYFSPIIGTPLALITETNAAAAYAQTLSFFNVRVFIVGIGVIALVVMLVLIFNQLITPPLIRLRTATQAITSGDFSAPISDTRRGDEIGVLAASFAVMRDQVRGLIEEQEARLAARARDFSATQEISRVAASQRDLQTLMDRVVALIVERFPNIYHAQVFLLNQEGSFAVLRSSTGEAGRKLLERGHRLAVGSVSVIGQVTDQGRIVVARDTAVSQVHRRNEFLPDTRAELAIPLRIGNRVIGALDVQSKLNNTFTEDQVNVLQTMADLVAVAIENTRLYEQSLQRAAEIEENNRQATLRAWQEFMRDQRTSSLVQQAGAVQEAGIPSELRQRAMREGQLTVGSPTERHTIPVAVPIRLRGQVLGSVEWELPASGFGEDKLELARELAERLAFSLDNARLFQESQRATERERLVNDIAAKLTSQTSIDTILQTAVREVGQALRAPQVSIRLRGGELQLNGNSHSPDEPRSSSNGHHN